MKFYIYILVHELNKFREMESLGNLLISISPVDVTKLFHLAIHILIIIRSPTSLEAKFINYMVQENNVELDLKNRINLLIDF